MEEPIKIESWADIKKLREEIGVSLFALSEKMRLPQERIIYLEDGDFSNADPVITRLQLKNYCKHLDLDYEEIIELSGLNIPKTDIPAAPLGDSIKIKKTRSYRGRKKEPSKGLIYTLIVAAVVAGIFFLNWIANNLNITSDVFEMTEEQVSSLDRPLESADSASFKPSLPQAHKEEVEKDIIEGMSLYHKTAVSFPLKIDVFPKSTLSYREQSDGQQPKEDFIMKNSPKSLLMSRPGRMVFYNTKDTRFVVDGFAFRENDNSVIVFEVNMDRELSIFIK